MVNIKIFENDTLLNCIKRCLAEGYFPATLEEIKEFKEKGLIDKNKWYDTSTITYKRVKRKATLEELQNIEKVWKDGGRSWVADRVGSYSCAGGNYVLNNDSGRLLGVAPEAQSDIKIENNLIINEEIQKALKKQAEKAKIFGELALKDISIIGMNQGELHLRIKNKIAYEQEIIELKKELQSYKDSYSILQEEIKIMLKKQAEEIFNKFDEYACIKDDGRYIRLKQKYLNAQDKFNCVVCGNEVSVKKGSGIKGDVVCESNDCTKKYLDGENSVKHKEFRDACEKASKSENIQNFVNEAKKKFD